MKQVQNNNYIVIQSFMVTDLCLKGNKLLLYALIYGFTQDGISKFTGSLNYMAEWCNSSKQGVINALNELIDVGLIYKNVQVINGNSYVEYYAKIDFSEEEVVNKVDRSKKLTPSQQSLTTRSTKLNGVVNKVDPIIYLYTRDNILKEKIDKKEKDELEDVLNEFVEMRKKKKKPLTDYAFKLIIKKLFEISEDINTQIQVLRQSIKYSWIDVYPLKNNFVKVNTRGDIKPDYSNITNPQISNEDIEKYLRE